MTIRTVYECNICGSSTTPFIGLKLVNEEEFSKINPRDAIIHICTTCLHELQYIKE